MPNFGDDMLTRGWINYLKSTYPDCHIYLDAVDPIVANSLFDGVTCVNYLWQLAQALGGEGSVTEKFSNPNLLPKRERLMTAIFNTADSIHLLGGGYINELWAANLKLIELVAYFSEKHGFPAYATGLGLQPLSEQNAIKISPFIDKYAFFDVRDVTSFTLINNILPGKVSYIGDDYFCFPFADVARLVDNESPTLRLCLHNELAAHEDEEKRFLTSVEKAINMFLAKNPESAIKFYEFRPGSDGAILNLLKVNFPQIEMVFFETIWEQGLSFSDKDYFVSTRFHFQLIVSSLGLRGISFYWSDYYKNKFESLQNVSQWNALQVIEEELEPGLFLTERNVSFAPEFYTVLNKKQALPEKLYGRFNPS
ncbi:hypothetical protein CYR23_19425 [Chimaeribacter arupi]|nr:hypothetical protein CYR23_19425 [Chimaeribacter arupi]